MPQGARKEDVVTWQQQAQVLPPASAVSTESFGWTGVALRQHLDMPVGEAGLLSCSDHSLCVVTRGSWEMTGRFEAQSRKIHLFTDDFAFCPAQASEWMRWGGKCDLIHLYMSASLTERAVAELYDLDPHKIELHFSTQRRHPVIGRLLRMLCDEAVIGNPLGSLYADSLTQALAVALVHSCSTIRAFRSPLRAGGLTPLRLARVEEYIDVHLARNLQLDELAEIAGVGRSRFCQSFKQSIGLAPHAYVLRKRIERAQRLLAYNRMDLAEVALACGFSSQSHFTRVFGRATGATPMAWQRVTGHRKRSLISE